MLALVPAAEWVIYDRPSGTDGGVARQPGRLPTPVEVAAFEVGPSEWRRTFAATLEARVASEAAPGATARACRHASTTRVDLAGAIH